MTTEATTTSAQEKTTRGNGQAAAGKGGQKPRVLTRPGDIAGLVMMQIDAVNAKKDDLTIAIKGLADTCKQLVRAYAEHAKTIQRLQQRVKALEEKGKQN